MFLSASHTQLKVKWSVVGLLGLFIADGILGWLGQLALQAHIRSNLTNPRIPYLIETTMIQGMILSTLGFLLLLAVDSVIIYYLIRFPGRIIVCGLFGLAAGLLWFILLGTTTVERLVLESMYLCRPNC